jgi:glycosyltransferase involved in cell wall biosynthesis
MARILMIGLRYNEVPGGWTFFREMARRLASVGHHITFLTFQLPKTSRYDFIDGVDIFRVRSLYLPQIPLIVPDPVDLQRILRLIFREKVEVVYDVSSGVSPISSLVYLYLRASRLRLPWITHVCGELKDFAGSPLRRILFEAYLRAVSKLSMSHSRFVLAAGEPVYHRVLSLSVPPEKVKIVRVGPKESAAKFTSQDIGSVAARQMLGLTSVDFVIGSVGRLAFGKGLETLIVACGLLSDKIPELKLVIVGSGALEGKLRNLASQRLSLERVIFTGWVDRPNEVFPAMDVFVSASASEAGISAALIEAMSNELACVTTPFTDFMKTLQNGIVISKPDPPELAQALVTLHDDPTLRKTLGRNAKLSAEHALRIYDWQVYSTRVDETISSLLGSVADGAPVQIGQSPITQV